MAVDENGDEIINSDESESQKRIKQLSEKVRLASEDRDEKDKLLKESNEKYATLERENAFNSGFADILGTQPLAKDFKDEIKAKVMSGYSPEDATFAVLGKAGKLGSSPAPASPAGGSASTTLPTGQKSVSEMSLAEKRSQLEKEMTIS